MIKITIEPMDTFFFRDARSFTAGAGTTAEFSFPTPLTFFGAIGSAVLNSTEGLNLTDFFNKDYEHHKLGKYDADLKNTGMKLKGPFLHRNDEVFFPPPANLWISDIKQYQESFLAKPYNKNWLWDLKADCLNPLEIPKNTPTKIKLLNQYISIDVLLQYLSDSLEKVESRYENEFYIRENRYGHALSSDTLTVETGYFYTATHLRFLDEVEGTNYNKTGFILIAEGIDETDLPDKTIFLGGERRKAMIKVQSIDKIVPDQPEVLKKIQSAKRFFIYLMTPAIFINGWFRDWPLKFQGACLVGAAVNKPQYISGWMVNSSNFGGMPRPIMKAVPAGSVYFFEAKAWNDSQFEEMYSKYHFGESLSEKYSSSGFGVSLIGSW